MISTLQGGLFPSPTHLGALVEWICHETKRAGLWCRKFSLSLLPARPQCRCCNDAARLQRRGWTRWMVIKTARLLANMIRFSALMCSSMKKDGQRPNLTLLPIHSQCKACVVVVHPNINRRIPGLDRVVTCSASTRMPRQCKECCAENDDTCLIL